MLIKSVFQIGLAALFLCSCDAPVETADEFETCVHGVVAADLVLFTDFQTGLRDLVVAARPEFTELADINMALQIVKAEVRALHFDFLFRHERGRIQTDSGLSAFRNFDWTEEDEGALRSEEPVYDELQERVENLAAQNNGHPDWPQLRETFNPQRTEQPEYRELLEDFESRQADIDAMLNVCEA